MLDLSKDVTNEEPKSKNKKNQDIKETKDGTSSKLYARYDALLKERNKSFFIKRYRSI